MATTSSREFVRWQAFNELGHFRNDRLDYWHSLIANLIHNAHYKGKKSPQDWMPDFRPKQVQPPEMMEANLEALARAMGADVE